jgi:flagellar biosynthesis/type III secretory pathway protein FliH
VIPQVRDAALAVVSPELAVLSAMAHGKGEHGLEIALAALAGTRQLDAPSALLYDDLIRGSLNEATARALEELMAAGNYEYQSEFARRHRAEGRSEGIEAGLTKGREEGIEAGIEAGLAKGRAEALLETLAARGLSVSEAERAQIVDCTDVATLKRWQLKALTADAIEAIFVL